MIDDKYVLIKHLGNGGNALVYLCRNIETGEKLAMKILNCAEITKEIVNIFQREKFMHSSVQHPYIVKFHEAK